MTTSDRPAFPDPRWETQVREALAKSKTPLVRNLDADLHLEIFLVSAVAAILAIRFYLRLLHYPQLGSGALHVAHMLWGGLMLTAAVLITSTFLNRGAVRFAAFVGGLGFGTFIDEVGKFVTKDNDYFFKPSFSLMYVVFMAVVLIGHVILRRLYTPDECLVNALQEMEELALLDLDVHERGRALSLLDRSDPKNPLVQPLRKILLETPVDGVGRPGIYARGREVVRRLYDKLVARPRFQVAVIAFFIIQLSIKLVNVILVVFFPWVFAWQDGNQAPHVAQRIADLSMADWVQVASTAVSALLVAIGLIWLARSRVVAYRMLKRSVLVTVFITQFFMFYDRQLTAVIGLGVNLLLLAALQAGIDLERARGQPAATRSRLADH